MISFYNGTVLFMAFVALLGTHILFATLGGIMCEKVGNLNLGIEGLMLLGACFAAITGLETGNPFLAILMAAVAGGAGALIYAFLTVSLRANQVVTGLILTIFGTGLTGLVGYQYANIPLPDAVFNTFGAKKIPILCDIPFLGPIFFSQTPFILIAVVTAILLSLYYKKTRWGLNAKMVGENPAAADASGIPVNLYKYVHIIIGGCLCGIGGGFYCIAFVRMWQDNITAGAGWIAIALVIFSTWKPSRAILGAYLFGAVQGIAFKIQGGFSLFGSKPIAIPSAILSMLPYLITIIVLVFITIRKRREGQAPAALGVPYFREDR